jgi:pimeloyl-ACP methyl ester carboxylesterase
MRLALILAVLLLSACALTIDEDALLPLQSSQAGEQALTAPPGYVLTHRNISIGDLGQVSVTRLDNPASAMTLIYCGGAGYTMAAASKRMARLAALTGADLITFDYPGRGATNLPRTSDALIALGPGLMAGLKEAGWIGAGPLYAYGFSFGGASASNIARTGGFDGLILEAASSDIPAVGRNLAPGPLRPFLRLKVDEDVKRFDYFGYAIAANTPILVMGGRDDELARQSIVRRFAIDLEQAGARVTLAIVPGAHGQASYSDEGGTALRAFIAAGTHEGK